MAEKISAVYKITNTVTGDFYIGSSKNVKCRWANHKCPSKWRRCSNNPLYKDMQKYGVDKFVFEILEEVEIEHLKETEQQFIEKLKPTYNSIRANGWDFERHKEYVKEYNKEYHKYDKYKESHKKSNNKYNNKLCFYNGETLSLNALVLRFRRAGVEHPTLEAKKYILTNYKDKYIDIKGE